MIEIALQAENHVILCGDHAICLQDIKPDDIAILENALLCSGRELAMPEPGESMLDRVLNLYWRDFENE